MRIDDEQANVTRTSLREIRFEGVSPGQARSYLACLALFVLLTGSLSFALALSERHSNQRIRKETTAAMAAALPQVSEKPYGVFEHLIELNLRLGRYDEAFFWAERGRAQAALILWSM